MAILNSYSDIFFMRGSTAGLALLCISFLNYNTALCGLISVITAYSFAHFIGFKTEFLKSGFYTYNPLLVGLAIGHLFQISVLTLGFLALSSILSFLLTAMLAHLFSLYLGLQILSIPFIIVSSMVYLAAGNFSNLFVTGLYSNPVYPDLAFLPSYINAFFKSVGSIVFMPNSLSGLLICSLILLKSRILLMLAILGFVTGTVVHGLFIGSIALASTDVSSFNYILIAVALGGVFNLPSLKSYSIAMLAVAISTILISAVNSFWAQYGIPVFTLPFTIITLSFVYLLRLVEYPLVPVIFKDTPEQTLDYHLSTQNRFPSSAYTINLPFADTWKVWQGFDGEWTHQGLWRYAYDFVVEDAQGSHYKGDGSRLEDYYCYQQPVLSPVRGRVVKVVHLLPDNPIGSVDNINNWGNLIIIQDELGYFIELSHFSYNSIAIMEGSWVEPGTYLGLCGNSGYSPQPHIHVQVQASAIVGAATLPFMFVQYIEQDQYRSHGLPHLGSNISSAWVLPYYEQITTFILGEELHYCVYEDDKLLKEICIRVKMASDATFYFSHGGSKLYFGKDKGSFFLYHLEGNDPYLRMLYMAISSLPLYSNSGLKWSDSLSNSHTLSPIQAAGSTLLNAFLPKPILTHANYQFIDDNRIQGLINNSYFDCPSESLVTLDPYLKFKNIRLKNAKHTTELKRKPYV